MNLLSADYLDILLPLVSALVAGSLIGLERSYHGRPAGFRTHALVCLASAMLMLVTTNQWQWLGESVPLDTVRTDPTRMAQGIMTGIGFLGAGVIFMEGLTVRGLTTAASIWITAALGILFGIGFWPAAISCTFMTLLVLAMFRWVEQRIPTQNHMKTTLYFAADAVADEAEVREWFTRMGFSIGNMNYAKDAENGIFEYRLVVQTTSERQVSELAAAMNERTDLAGFSMRSVGN